MAKTWIVFVCKHSYTAMQHSMYVFIYFFSLLSNQNDTQTSLTFYFQEKKEKHLQELVLRFKKKAQVIEN